jgi:phosphatidylserine/phosphatidylglycerophosphate/cardiolipin synthase-like enzyme
VKLTKKICCCMNGWLLIACFVGHGFLFSKEAQTGFGKTHFVVGADAGHVSSDVASGRLKRSLHLPEQEQGRIAHVLFCPDDDTRGLLLDLIACEKKALYVAAFLLTDEVIARAIIDAKNRGVIVEVVTDQLCCEEGRGKVNLLHKEGIDVLVYCGKCAGHSNRSDIMHNKFIVFESNLFGRSILWTGSFNFTHSARLRNQENVLVVDDPAIVDRYRKQFSVLKTRCKRYHADLFGKKEQKLARKKNDGMHKHSIDQNLVRILGQA